MQTLNRHRQQSANDDGNRDRLQHTGDVAAARTETAYGHGSEQKHDGRKGKKRVQRRGNDQLHDQHTDQRQRRQDNLG